MNHDLIIIGGGAGGLGAARAARRVGASVALISDGPLGGDCTFTGCVPSKTLIAAARQGLGFEEALDRVEAAVATIAATETADVLRSEGVDVVEGCGRFVSATEVKVDGRIHRGDKVIVATGSSAVVPPIDGLADCAYLTNDTIFSLAPKPATLGILGGGPIGCELAQAFSRLGVSVTIFEGLGRLLSREEPEASTIVEAALRREGIDVVLGAMVARVGSSRGGVRVETNDGRSIEVDRLLVAVGRKPVTDGLDLEGIGVTLTKYGHIVTSDKLETNVDGVFAVGDVTGKLPYTHAADEMGRLAAGNALGRGQRGAFKEHWIPCCTFTDPEVARVGMTESEAARHSGRVAYLPLAELDRAVTDGQTGGYVKLIAGPRKVLRRLGGGEIIGATIVAPRAGEMIHEASLAMRTRMFTGRLAQAAHAYPTWSYGVQLCAGQFFGEFGGRQARPARKAG